MVKFASARTIPGVFLMVASALVACTVSKNHDESAFANDTAASGGDAQGAPCAGGDCCPDDPLKTEPGACGCGIPDEDRTDAAGCVPIKTALAHRYDFLGVGESVEDSVGSANGVIFGTTLNGDGTLSLAGGTSDQHLELPNGIISTLVDATFEVWLNWADGDPWQRIFDFGSSDTEGAQGTGATYLFLTPRSATDPARMRVAFSTRRREGETFVDAPPLVTGSSVHVAVVVNDAAGLISTYVNGVLEGTGSFEGHLADLTDVNNWIGRSQYAADPSLNATITEFRIYKAALTPQQIALTHRIGPDAAFLPPTTNPGGGSGSGGTAGSEGTGGRSGSSGGTAPSATGGSSTGGSSMGGASNGAASGGSGNNAGTSSGGATGMSGAAGNTANTDLKRGLVLYYDFDETSGNTVHDRLSPTNDGTVRGAATWSSGKVNGALRLAGGPGNTPEPQYVEAPPGILRSLQQTTIAAWIRWEGGPAWQRVFDFGTHTDSSFFFTPGVSGTALAALKTMDPAGRLVFLQSKPPPLVAEWTHVAVTWSPGTISIYTNGELSGISEPALPPGIPPSSLGITPRDFIGRSQVAEDPFFAGTVDEFRIYDRVLSKADVAAVRDFRP